MKKENKSLVFGIITVSILSVILLILLCIYFYQTKHPKKTEKLKNLTETVSEPTTTELPTFSEKETEESEIKKIELDENYLYGTGSYVLSDESMEQYLTRVLPSDAKYNTDEEVKDFLDQTLKKIYSGNLVGVCESISDYLDHHKFSDSCYARELLLIYEDTSYLGSYMDTDDQYSRAGLSRFVKTPSLCLMMTTQLDNPFANMLNPDTYYLSGFTIEELPYLLPKDDSHYELGGEHYKSNPSEVYRFRIKFEDKYYYAYVCHYSDTGESKVLQFENEEGSLIINPDAADLEDISGYSYDSGIYHYYDD